MSSGRFPVAVAATFTADPLVEPLQRLLADAALPADVTLAPYAQLFQQLADPTSVVGANRAGVNVLLVRLEDLVPAAAGRYDGDLAAPDAEAALARTLDELGARLAAAVASAGATPWLLVLGRPTPATAADATAAARWATGAARLAARVAPLAPVELVTPDAVAAEWPTATADDPAANALAHVPYTPAHFAALAGAVARRVHARRGAPYKVIVLDCDNTLWQGVCGEVGTAGVSFPPGHVALQEFAVARHREGMLLCLASKNVEQDALAVFDARRDEMPLHREHLVTWRINWLPKSENLRALAAELQLGLDSFVFVDDDHVVCAEVRANCPEVLVVEVPKDPAAIPDALARCWAFDRVGTTAEDAQRTKLYQENAARERLRREAGGFEDFLASLQLEVDVMPMRAEQAARVAQLTQRTNQFNFTTVRRTEPELAAFLADGGECLTVEVRDRFGDYGLVGVVLHRAEGDALVVDTFLLSCRALGRGVEHRMLAHLGALAEARGLATVACRLVPTAKNQPARDFLGAVGQPYATPDGDATRHAFPAAAAAALEYRPSAAPADADDAPATAAAPAPDAARVSRPRALERIGALRDGDALAALLQPEARALDADGAEAPRDDVERRLAALWEEVLRVSPVGRTHDFFALGGTSILGVQLFSEIEARFGRHLSIATLFEAPTVAALAERLRDGAATRWSPLVPIKVGGARPPLYCMHAAGGNVLFYRDLARHLPEDQPVYGLQARGLDRTQTHHDRVEDMAACYLEEIRAFQPRGPYHLCGSSFGGLVAYEMAQQLRAVGDEVALLALFDTYGPGYPRYRGGAAGLLRKAHFQWRRVARIAEQLRARDGDDRGAYLRDRIAKGRMLLKRRVLYKQNEFARKFAAATGGELPKDLQRNQKAIQHALRTYVPKAYAGAMTLFRASEQPFGAIPEPALGWQRVVQGAIEIHEVPGAHGVITVDPAARHLAAALLPCLERAQGGVRVPTGAGLPSPAPRPAGVAG